MVNVWNLVFSINVAKSIFLVSFGRLIRHIVSEQRITIDPYKITINVSSPFVPLSLTSKDLLDNTGFYRIYIFCYAVITMSLTGLLKIRMKL